MGCVPMCRELAYSRMQVLSPKLPTHHLDRDGL